MTTIVPQFRCYLSIDIILVVDASKSVSGNWHTVLEFLKNLIGRFEIATNKTNVAILLYSSVAELHMSFADGSDKAMVEGQIGSLSVSYWFVFILSQLNFSFNTTLSQTMHMLFNINLYKYKYIIYINITNKNINSESMSTSDRESFLPFHRFIVDWKEFGTS